MTVQDVTSEVTFTGDGAQTSFAFNFRADDVSWLDVSYQTNFDQVTLNGNQDDNPGGTVDYLAAPPNGQQITLTRTVPLVQDLDYTRYGPFDSESTEDMLDKIMMALQDRNQSTARKSKSITVESPSAAEDLSLFYLVPSGTIRSIEVVLRGSNSPSLTWTLRHDTDRSAAGTEVVTGGTTTTNTTDGEEITVFDAPDIPANSFIWLETTGIGGSVESVHITITFSDDIV